MDKAIPSSRMDDRSIDIFDLGYDYYEDHDDEIVMSSFPERTNYVGTSDKFDGCFLKTPTIHNKYKKHHNGQHVGLPNIFD